MSKIHSTAIIEDGAKIGEDVEIGPYAVIGPEVVLGNRVKIHGHAMVSGSTILHDEAQVFPFAHIGGKTQDLKFAEGNKTYVEVGERTVLREYVTVNCGTSDGESTVIGKDCLLMAYCHVAHGCVLGNRVIISNSTQLAGEVTVEDYATISGLCGFHQFTRVGRYCMVAAASAIKQDVLPYMITEGSVARGLNIVRLTRCGFSEASVKALKEAYRILCRSGLNVSQAIEAIKNDVEQTEEVANLVEFVSSSKRGCLIK